MPANYKAASESKYYSDTSKSCDMDVNNPQLEGRARPRPLPQRDPPIPHEPILDIISSLMFFFSIVPLILSIWLSARAGETAYPPTLKKTLYCITAAVGWSTLVTGACMITRGDGAENNPSRRQPHVKKQMRVYMYVIYFGWIVLGAAAMGFTSVFGFALSCPKDGAITHCKQLFALQALLWVYWVLCTGFIVCEAFVVYHDKRTQRLEEERLQQEAIRNGNPAGMNATGAGAQFMMKPMSP